MDESALLLLSVNIFDPQGMGTMLRASWATQPFSGPIGRAKPTAKKNPLLQSPRFGKERWTPAIRAITLIPKSLGSRSVQKERDLG